MLDECVDFYAAAGCRPNKPHIGKRLKMPPCRPRGHAQLASDFRRLVLPCSEATQDGKAGVAGQCAKDAREVWLRLHGKVQAPPVSRAAGNVPCLCHQSSPVRTAMPYGAAVDLKIKSHLARQTGPNGPEILAPGVITAHEDAGRAKHT